MFYAVVYGCDRRDLEVVDNRLYTWFFRAVELVVEEFDENDCIVVAIDEDFCELRRFVWSTINGQRTSVASVFTVRSCSIRDLIVEGSLFVEWSNVKNRSPTVSLFVVDILSLTTGVDCSVKELQKWSSSSSKIVLLVGIIISSIVIVLSVWYGIDVSFVVIEFDINWEDDAADCGGDRNVLFCEIIGIDSDDWGTIFVVDRLNQSVRNFPWLFIVDNRLDISIPSTLINSASKKIKIKFDWIIQNKPCRKYTLIIERDVESNSII